MRMNEVDAGRDRATIIVKRWGIPISRFGAPNLQVT
jgi:hypothetical protein